MEILTYRIFVSLKYQLIVVQPVVVEEKGAGCAEKTIVAGDMRRVLLSERAKREQLLIARTKQQFLDI